MALASKKLTHVNPVYDNYFADPFVWKHDETYFAIGTGQNEADGRPGETVFPLLRSENFFDWEPAGHALTRPDAALGTHFWAPEIAHADGKFYLYYSVGFWDKRHQLRVGVSDTPQGPYVDAGKTLVDPRVCPFAIDAHPFQDDDGQWYLFYARDFLDASASSRAGTGLAARRMKSMTELESEEIIILRAHADWQLFQADRLMYGKTWDWHTLEGPFVRKHDGLYYCFYSGGRWETDTYGVDYHIAENILGPYTAAGTASRARVLRTIPGKVIGPGHNSIVTGPDGLDYIVYHAWDKGMTARRLFIDRLVWTPEGPRAREFQSPVLRSSTAEGGSPRPKV
jgi:beta-xylosidase